MQTERDTDNKNNEQTTSESVMQLVENIEIPPDVDRRMDEVMEEMDE